MQPTERCAKKTSATLIFRSEVYWVGFMYSFYSNGHYYRCVTEKKFELEHSAGRWCWNSKTQKIYTFFAFEDPVFTICDLATEAYKQHLNHEVAVAE